MKGLRGKRWISSICTFLGTCTLYWKEGFYMIVEFVSFGPCVKICFPSFLYASYSPSPRGCPGVSAPSHPENWKPPAPSPWHPYPTPKPEPPTRPLEPLRSELQLYFLENTNVVKFTVFLNPSIYIRNLHSFYAYVHMYRWLVCPSNMHDMNFAYSVGIPMHRSTQTGIAHLVLRLCPCLE